MGNSKSKQRMNVGHERLNENDQRYFAKVQARNSTTLPSRRFRKPHPVLAMRSCVTALTSIETPRGNDEDDDDEEDDTSKATENNSPKALNATPYRVGPLPPKMKIADDVSTTTAFSRAKPTLTPISEGATSPTSVVLPSPKARFAFPQDTRRASMAQRRLEKARSNQIRPTDSFTSVDLSIASSQSSTGSHVIQDYYTEMMDEAHRESRQAEEEGRLDASRTFDSMLPNGMVWAEFARAGRVTSVAFSRSVTKKDATDYPLLMAVGTDDGTVTVVEIMDISSTPLHKQIEFGSNQSKKFGSVKELPREGTVRSLDFSPDGRWLVAGGDDCVACLSRIRQKEFQGLGGEAVLDSIEMVQEFEREDRVYCVQFSPDGSRVAMGGYDGIVAIASMQQTEGTQELTSPRTCPLSLVHEILRSGLVLCLDWSPDGTLLAAGGSSKCCILIDAGSPRVVGEIQRDASVEAVKWKPDGTHVAVGSVDGVVVVVNVGSQKVAGEIARGPSRHIKREGSVNKASYSSIGSCIVNSISWSPDGNFLAICGSDHCCAIVETESFAVLHEIRRSDNVTCVDWTDRMLLGGIEGRYLAIGGEDCSVAIMKTGNEENRPVSVVVAGDDSAASSSYFSIGSASSISQHEWVLREDSFFDIEEVESFSKQTAAPYSPLENTRTNAVVAAVSFSRHRKGSASLNMAIAYSNGCVTIISTKDWRITQQFTFSKTIKSIDFSRKSDYMALGGDDGCLSVLSTNGWSTVKEIQIASTAIAAVRFSRRNERLAIGSFDGILTLLNPKDGWKIEGEIETSDAGISCIDWSSRHLAIGRFDGTLSVHEASRVYENFFLPEAEITRGGKEVHSVSFGVSGQFLAVGDGMGKVGIYSVKGGWVLCHQLNTPSAVLCTSWSSDGGHLAFGGDGQEMGARVVDTVAWKNVKEMHKLKPTEFLLTLDWSNDDKWIVLACSNGSLHVVDTTDWKVRKSFPGLSIDAAADSDGSKSMDSKETENRTKYSNVLEGDLQWRDIPQVMHFLAISKSFVEANQHSDPPANLRPLLKCVHMLTIHVQWVCTKDNAVVKRLSRVDDGQPIATLLWVLDLCTDAMKQAMRPNTDHSSYSSSFLLTPRDLRRIQAWNDQWLLTDPIAPSVEITALQDADEGH